MVNSVSLDQIYVESVTSATEKLKSMKKKYNTDPKWVV